MPTTNTGETMMSSPDHAQLAAPEAEGNAATQATAPLPPQENGTTPRRPVVSVFSPDYSAGRLTVTIGLLHTLSQAYAQTTVFQPISTNSSAANMTIALRAAQRFSHPLAPAGQDPVDINSDRAQHIGLDTSSTPSFSRTELDIVTHFHTNPQIASADAVVCMSSDNPVIADPYLLHDNSALAADLQASVVVVINGENLSACAIAQSLRSSISFVEEAGNKVIGAFVCPGNPELRQDVLINLVDYELPVWFVENVDTEECADSPDTDSPDTDSHDADSAQAADPDQTAHLDAIIDQHLAAFQKAVEPLQLLPLIVRDRPRVLTPANFQYRLMHQAAQQKKTIILPEGDDDRILRAADYLLEFNAFHAVIVGDASQITRHAEALGLTHVASQATIQSMNDKELISRMVPELVRIRAKHGMSEEQAREALKDPSTFGTMYVQLGLADGMVSGARHSTANTVRPALQIIKTRPGIKLASGVMVMCLGRRVDIYADVALLPNPTASQLAEIAGESARTARQFGLDPYIGMLSYSTVDSGKGPDVDLVKEATQIAKEAFPKEKITGPIQFDAAWDATVAALKAPGDSVAGHVNTFVMPSLSASNIGIKAIQRVGEGVAIGPILQGLNKPVNDLSRGATTRDIINTIALTCVQAQAPQNM